jgi:chromosome condensin MukBEF MukE localization factor
MLSGIRIYSTNPIWRHILSELGATVTDAPNVLDINFDKIAPDNPVSVTELKSLILSSADDSKILQSVFGDNVPQLSEIQKNIIISLVRTGGMTSTELKNALGYMPDVATHTIDTAIYTLRKLCGHNFIVLENGVYKIGSV